MKTYYYLGFAIAVVVLIVKQVLADRAAVEREKRAADENRIWGHCEALIAAARLAVKHDLPRTVLHSVHGSGGSHCRTALLMLQPGGDKYQVDLYSDDDGRVRVYASMRRDGVEREERIRCEGREAEDLAKAFSAWFRKDVAETLGEAEDVDPLDESLGKPCKAADDHQPSASGPAA